MNNAEVLLTKRQKKKMDALGNTVYHVFDRWNNIATECLINHFVVFCTKFMIANGVCFAEVSLSPN